MKSPRFWTEGSSTITRICRGWRVLCAKSCSRARSLRPHSGNSVGTHSAQRLAGGNDLSADHSRLRSQSGFWISAGHGPNSGHVRSIEKHHKCSGRSNGNSRQDLAGHPMGPPRHQEHVPAGAGSRKTGSPRRGLSGSLDDRRRRRRNGRRLLHRLHHHETGCDRDAAKFKCGSSRDAPAKPSSRWRKSAASRSNGARSPSQKR